MTRTPRRFSLALLISLVVTLGMLVLTATLIFQAHRGMESAKLAATSDSAEELVHAVNDRIHAITTPPMTALLVLRDSSLTAERTLEERLGRLSVLADVLRVNAIVDAVYVGYPDGDFFLLRRVPDDHGSLPVDLPKTTRYILQTVSVDAGGQRQADLRYYNEHLRLLDQRPNPDQDYDPRTRGWYQRALASDGMTLTRPYVFYTTHAIGMTLAQAASNGDAVVGIDVTVSALSHQLEDLKLTPNTEIAIVDQKGQVVAYPDQDRMVVGSADAPDLARLSDLSVPALDQVESMPVSTQARQFTSQGSEWFGISADLRSIHTSGLRMLIAIPADELMADVWQLVRDQLFIALIIVLVLLVLGALLGRQLGRPLKRLAGEVEALSRFHFDTPISSGSRIHEAHKLGSALTDMSGTIRSFQSISLTLNRARDLSSLLNGILNELISILNEKHGRIFLYREPTHELEIAAAVGPSELQRIDNIQPEQSDHDIIRTLRHTVTDHAVYAVLRNREQALVGVLMIDLDDVHFEAMDDHLIRFVHEIAGSAAVAIETRQLIESQQSLIEGVIRLIADAIDAKSPYTSGHCERVPQLAKMLVDQAERSRDPPFADFSMNERERYEFHIGAWLHDCGKITSPENVVDKATKLETIYNRIHEIRTRFEVLHRDAEIRYLDARIAGADEAEARRQRDATQAALQEEFAFIAQCNQGGEFMADADIARLDDIGDRLWQRHFSDRLGLSHDEALRFEGRPEPELPVEEKLLDDKPEHQLPWAAGRRPPVTQDDPRNRWGFDMVLPDVAYDYGERYNLSIRRGTLTPEERFKINEHIVQTIIMLDALPLPDRLAQVPRFAGTHHEKMDGTGYPRRLTGEALSIPEKAMSIADIFEALTAVDRPYKEGKTLTQSLDILHRMALEGHVDPDVFNLFLRSGVYLDYARRFLAPQQIDEVDIDRYLVGEQA